MISENTGASTHRGKITPNGLCNETVKGIELKL